MRGLALLFNALPVRWQRRVLSGAHDRFLVGVAGIGVDADGRVLLARHRFGSPQWRLLGGFVSRRERLEDALAREIREETGLLIEVGPVLEASTGFHWARVELVYPYRVIGGHEALTAEILELAWFPAAALPDVRADQRGVVERRLLSAIAWARGRPVA